jgi:hypothetical protein
LLKHRSGFAMGLLLVAQLIFPRPFVLADNDATTQATAMQQRLNESVQNKTIQADQIGKLQNEIADLIKEAQQLDQLQAEVNNLEPNVSDLDTAQKDAGVQADNAANKLQADIQDAQTTAKNLEDSEVALCQQLGGSLSGQQCEFRCPADNMGPCNQKSQQVDQKTAQDTAQIQALEGQLETEKSQADALRTDATTKESDWKTSQDNLDKEKSQLADLTDQFNKDVNRIDQELDDAHIKPSLKGQGWQDLNNVHQHGPAPAHGSDFDRSNGNVIISNDSSSIPAPPAASKSPAFAQKFDEARKTLDTATADRDAAQKALSAAEASGTANQADLQRLIQDYSKKQGAAIYAQYNVKLLGGSQPKP